MNRNTQIPSLPINKQQQRLYPASSDPTFEHETYEDMKAYLNNATAYFGQILYCKENDKHYRIAKNNEQMILKEVIDKTEYDSKLDKFSEQLKTKFDKVVYNNEACNIEFYTNDVSKYTISLASAMADPIIKNYLDSLIEEGKISGVRVGDNTITQSKLNNVAQNQYPFQCFSKVPLEIKNAIKDIRLYNADVNKQYSVALVRRGWTNSNIKYWQVMIYEVNGNTLVKGVAKFEVLDNYIEPTGITVIIASQMNASGITAEITIDWSKLTDGCNYNEYGYDITGLDLKTYYDLYINYNELNIDIPLNHYPFQCFSRPHLEIKNAIKDVRLYNADVNKQYSVASVRRGWTNSNIKYWQVMIYEVNGNTLVKGVAKFEVLDNYIEPTGITVIIASQMNASGITAEITIDWSELPNGCNYNGYGYDITGLDLKTYYDLYINYNELNIDIPLNQYPFQCYSRPNLEIKKAIKDVRLYNADVNKQYSVALVRRGWTNSNIKYWQVMIYEVNGNTLVKGVAKFEVLDNYIEPTGITVIIASQMNASGITAEITIDWSKLTDGCNYSGYGYDIAGLDLKTLKNTESKSVDCLTTLNSTIYAVVDKEINIYFENIINMFNLENVKIEVLCSVGKMKNDRWTLTPTIDNVGNYPITINVYTDYENVIASIKTTLIVVAKTIGNNVNRKVMFIGDSTTDHGYLTKGVKELFTNDTNMDITLMGTRSTLANDNLHEGRSGWTITNYVTKSNSPFMFDGQLSFANYMNNNGFNGLERVLIHLGINDLLHVMTSQETVLQAETSLNNLEKLVTSIHAYDRNIKIGICLTIPPAHDEVADFGKNGGRPNWKYKRFHAIFVNKLIEKFKDRTSENIWLVPYNSNIDTVHNMTQSLAYPNTRNTREKIMTQFDQIHPPLEAGYGYYQMSDCAYYWLKYLETI